jgi:NAD(P)-dependent dehydrogenase (short-subunit alcohol dehydrogenase family)
MERLAGKVALVTGAEGPLGAAVCRALAAHGASVVSRPGSAAITTFAGAAEAVTEAIATRGRLDMLVCAGGQATITERSLAGVDEAGWNAALAAGLRALAGCAQAAARQMIEQREGGRIVTFASPTAFAGDPPVRAAVSVATMGLTSALHKALEDDSISVNCVMPVEGAITGAAELVTYLCSPEGAPVRGRYLSVSADEIAVLGKPLAMGAWNVVLTQPGGWRAESLAAALPPIVAALSE